MSNFPDFARLVTHLREKFPMTRYRACDVYDAIIRYYDLRQDAESIVCLILRHLEQKGVLDYTVSPFTDDIILFREAGK